MATLNDGAVRVLQRPAEPGTARRHAGAAVLRVRPPHQRERQRRHRPRRGQRDDGAWAAACAAASTAPRRTCGRPPDNPTLENNGDDVRYETDFRSVYARVIDDWLGASSPTILGGRFPQRSAGVPVVDSRRSGRFAAPQKTLTGGRGGGRNSESTSSAAATRAARSAAGQDRASGGRASLKTQVRMLVIPMLNPGLPRLRGARVAVSVYQSSECLPSSRPPVRVFLAPNETASTPRRFP